MFYNLIILKNIMNSKIEIILMIIFRQLGSSFTLRLNTLSFAPLASSPSLCYHIRHHKDHWALLLLCMIAITRSVLLLYLQRKWVLIIKLLIIIKCTLLFMPNNTPVLWYWLQFLIQQIVILAPKIHRFLLCYSTATFYKWVSVVYCSVHLF